MAMRSHSYAGFSGPQRRIDAGLLDALAAEHARGYIERFREEFRPELKQRTAGVLDVLDGWLSQKSDFDTAWDPAFAAIARTCLSQSRPSADVIARRAAGLALCLGRRGECNEWEAALARSTRLRWGRWLLPAGHRIEVSNRRGRRTILIQTANGPFKVDFVRGRGDWHSRQARGLQRVRMERHQCLVMARSGLPTLEFQCQGFRYSGEPQEDMVAACGRAVALLRRHAPQYLRWVDRVLRGVIPCRALTTAYRSGSDVHQPGLVQMSFPAGAAAHAEMLVHESAHQYFYLLTRLGPVDDGSDRELHYSPVRQTRRPIDKILLAYHAFANVLLFYRECQRSRLKDGGYCRVNEKELLPQIQQLEVPLRSSRALTPLGRALWEPLAVMVR
jgi:HEXXH motif-containing protein